MLETPHGPGSDLVLSLQPEEHLKAHLLGARTHALQHVQDVSTRMHAKVLQLCRDVQSDVRQHERELEEYSTAAKPSDHNQQCARNEVRSGLKKVVQSTQVNLKSLISASREPEDALRIAKATHLSKIDGVMQMLEQFRAESLSVFQELEEKEKVECEASEAAALSLAPSLDFVDGFVRHLTKEVDEETAKAIQVHTDKLEVLKLEQLHFVNANDSRERNPIFAKVIEDIASTQRLLEEHSGQRESYQSFLKDWQEVLWVMPKHTHLPSTSKKHWFWSRIF